MNSHSHGNFQFRADPIRARNQNRFLPLFCVQGKQRAEAADSSQHCGGECSAGQMPYALLGIIGNGDIHSGIGIFHVWLP